MVSPFLVYYIMDIDLLQKASIIVHADNIKGAKYDIRTF